MCGGLAESGKRAQATDRRLGRNAGWTGDPDAQLSNPEPLGESIGAAIAALHQAGLSAEDETLTLVIFVVLGSLSVLGAVAFYFIGGSHARSTLEQWKVWLAHNNATVMAVLFLVFGVFVLSQGLGLLTA